VSEAVDYTSSARLSPEGAEGDPHPSSSSRSGFVQRIEVRAELHDSAVKNDKKKMKKKKKQGRRLTILNC
jgi:hypothetical protein